MPGCPSSVRGGEAAPGNTLAAASNCILDAHCNAATSRRFVLCLLVRKKNARNRQCLRQALSPGPEQQQSVHSRKTKGGASELPHEQSALITSSSRVHGLPHKEESGYSLASHARQTQNHSHPTFIYALKEHKTAPNNFGECQETREPGETGC